MKATRNGGDWKRIADDFEEVWNMPNVIGAVGWKHMVIGCPKGPGTQDYNYKGFYSRSLLAICGAKYSFTLVDVGQYGSNNDSDVLLNSEMGQHSKKGPMTYPNLEK